MNNLRALKKWKIRREGDRIIQGRDPRNWNITKTAAMLSFVLPVSVMIVLFAVKHIYPFGDRTFLSADLYHQYMPFFSELVHRIRAGEDLNFSFNVGIGSNFLALFGYYLASPFHIFGLLVPESHLTEFLSYLTVLKIGLCGLTCFLYLRKHFQGKGAEAGGGADMGALLFSCFYAMSGFMAAYNYNIMWLDCVVLLPLIVLGLERLVKEGRCGLYCVALGMSIFTNFYISIMICIFLVLYFCLLLVTERHRLRSIGYFSLFSLLAGGMASVLLVPEVLALLETDFGDMDFPRVVESYFSVLDILARHCVCVLTERGLDHWPNIYCGSAVLMLVPMYLMNRKISIREKFCRMAICGFMLLSFGTNILDFIWHGLNYPDSLPARQSFIYIFLVLTMCYDAFLHVKETDAQQILYGFLAAAAFILFCEKFVHHEDFEPGVKFLTLVFVSIYAVLLYLYRTRDTAAGNKEIRDRESHYRDIWDKKVQDREIQDKLDREIWDKKVRDREIQDKQIWDKKIQEKEAADKETGDIAAESKITGDKRRKRVRRGLATVALLAVALECGINTWDTSIANVSRSAYLEPLKDYRALYESVREQDGRFYRVEKFSRKTKNDGTLAGYPTASVFSSTMNSYVMDMYRMLGMRHSKVYYCFDGATALVSAMLNVNYMFGESEKYENSLYTLLGHSGDVWLYECSAVLPFGYVAPTGFEMSGDYADDGIQVQERMIEDLGISRKLFVRASAVSRGDDLEFTPRKGGCYYAMLTSGGIGNVDYIGGSTEEEHFQELQYGSILYLGYLEKDQTITLTNGAEDGAYQRLSAEIYRMDEETLREAIELLSARHMENVTWEGSRITGELALTEPGRLVLTVPYEAGWTVRINGRETEGELFGGCLMAFDLKPGEYDFELTYVPAGVKAGAAMSAASIALFAVLMLIQRKMRHKVQN